MARTEVGFVKLHRKILDSDIGRNYLLLGLWVTLIRWANWTESKINWRGIPRTLGRGEILTSVKELATYGEVDRRTVDRWLNYLVLRGSISVEKAPRGSRDGIIINVINYERYQSVDALYSHESANEHVNESANEHANEGRTYKELKNIRSSKAEGKVSRKKQDAVSFATSEELVSELGENWFNAQLAVYNDRAFIDFETKKAFAYYSDDDAKNRPTTVGGWKRKLSSWFGRGWPRYTPISPKQAVNGIVER